MWLALASEPDHVEVASEPLTAGGCENMYQYRSRSSCEHLGLGRRRRNRRRVPLDYVTITYIKMNYNVYYCILLSPGESNIVRVKLTKSIKKQRGYSANWSIQVCTYSAHLVACGPLIMVYPRNAGTEQRGVRDKWFTHTHPTSTLLV